MKKKVLSKTKPKKSDQKALQKNRSKSTGFLSAYLTQREDFYRQNPNIRPLMGVLIVATAICIGLFFHKKNQIFIGLELDKLGIDYRYIEPVK